VPPLEQLEHMKIDGIDLEAFNTSGGLGSLGETLKGKVRNLNYKTMRFPGHRDILKLLIEDLGFRHHRDELKKVFERSLPATDQDQVAIFVSCVGDKDGRLLEKTYAKIVLHNEIDGQRWTAIQITTAAGITAVLDLLREGAIPSKGFVRNEDVPFEKFITNRFGKHYA
jgi:saccharopine dehydrogenase-like NADP-dependent oxidoreductase